jgi:hypothetical protein
MFVPLRLPIKVPVFWVKGQTRDFPRVPFQAVDANQADHKSGASDIQTALLYIKKSRFPCRITTFGCNSSPKMGKGVWVYCDKRN